MVDSSIVVLPVVGNVLEAEVYVADGVVRIFASDQLHFMKLLEETVYHTFPGKIRKIIYFSDGQQTATYDFFDGTWLASAA